MELVDLGITVMSKRLREALDRAGVDNIEYYPAVLTNTETGEKYEYFAFKVIGLVAAADLDSSEYTSFDGDALIDTSFETLAIDESKAHGLKLFRLAENINALMVHEEVKNVIEESGINTLDFLKPDEFVQI